jgi:hypothetical protein
MINFPLFTSLIFIPFIDLIASYTIQNDIDIHRSIVISSIRSTLEAKGYTIESIHYIDDIKEVVQTLDRNCRKGWTDYDSVILYQLLEKMFTARVRYKRTKHYDETVLIKGYVESTSMSDTKSVGTKLAHYLFSRINLAKSDFNADFYWWLVDYDRPDRMEYQVMARKYYCEAVGNYLR